MKIDKDIYVDVDGTLTRESWVNDGKGDFGVIRNNVDKFLEFLVENFKNVYWLSSNRYFCFEYLNMIGKEELSKKINYIEWEKSKYDAIDYTRGFYFFDDEIEYDYYQEFGFLEGEIPLWKKEPYISKYNPTIHTMYYVPSNAPLNILDDIIIDIKKREKLD
jgi:hypothetical protein